MDPRDLMSVLEGLETIVFGNTRETIPRESIERRLANIEVMVGLQNMHALDRFARVDAIQNSSTYKVFGQSRVMSVLKGLETKVFRQHMRHNPPRIHREKTRKH